LSVTGVGVIILAAGSFANPASALLFGACPKIREEVVTAPFRVGIGHDTHRLEAGRPLMLGGVRVPHDCGAVGHSDADVLLHALIDALVGAAGLGDIGEWFPSDDPVNRDRSSSDMLAHVLSAVRAKGWRLVNADAIVFAERPNLSRHKAEIRETVARLLGVAKGAVNVKAKTGEKVGPLGREEALSAEVVVLLERKEAASDPKP
jgi:2-C-methyl-D-erythritol 2,4-cyclodiphosphate synthase